MATATKRKNETTTEDLAEQMEALKSDFASLSKTLADYGKTKGNQIADAAENGVKSASEAGKVHAQKLKSQAVDIGHQAEDFVAEKPAISLGIAAGAGFLAGLLASRR